MREILHAGWVKILKIYIPILNFPFGKPKIKKENLWQKLSIWHKKPSSVFKATKGGLENSAIETYEQQRILGHWNQQLDRMRGANFILSS